MSDNEKKVSARFDAVRSTQTDGAQNKATTEVTQPQAEPRVRVMMRERLGLMPRTPLQR